MTRDEAKKIVMVMSASYPNWRPLDMKFTVDAWAMMLEEYNYDKISMALKAHTLGDTSGFAPSIGQLIDKLQMLSEPEEMNELEAWSLVYKAIGNSGYNAESEFEKLPEVCQKAVGNPSNLKEWSMMEMDTVRSVEQSHFIKSYRAAAQRLKEERRMPENIRMLIREVNHKTIETIKVEEIEDKKEKDGIPFPERLREKFFRLFEN